MSEAAARRRAPVDLQAGPRGPRARSRRARPSASVSSLSAGASRGTRARGVYNSVQSHAPGPVRGGRAAAGLHRPRRTSPSIGRANDNDIVLNDFSVSRRHAYLKKEEATGSSTTTSPPTASASTTRPCRGAVVKDGDQVLIGTFVLRFREDPTVSQAGGQRLVDSTSTCIRPIAEFNEDFGLESGAVRHAGRGVDRASASASALDARVQEQGLRDPRPGRQGADLRRRPRHGARQGHGPDLRVPRRPTAGSCSSRKTGRCSSRISRFKSKRRPTSDGTAPYSRTIVDMVDQAEGRDPDLGRPDRRALREPASRSGCSRSAPRCARRSGAATRSSASSTSTRRCTPGASRTRTSTC